MKQGSFRSWAAKVFVAALFVLGTGVGQAADVNRPGFCRGPVV